MNVDTSIDRSAAGGFPIRRVPLRRPVRALVDLIGEGPPPVRAQRVARRIAEAVTELHLRGAVHGGLSPSVISVGARGEIALASPDERLSTVARLRYASPEVARGQAATSASDVFSLALIVRELLEGQPARTGVGDEAAIEAIDGRVSVPSGLPGQLRELALLSTGQHADQRPSAWAWADALARLERVGLWRSGRRILVLAAAAIIALLAFNLRTSVSAKDRVDLRYDDARGVIDGLLAGTYRELGRVEDIRPLAAAGERALAAVMRIDEADRDAGDRELLARMLLWNGEAQRLSGNLDEAEGLLTRAAARSVDVPDDRLAATIELHAVTSLGEMARDARELEAAREFFQRALRVGEARLALGEADRDLRVAYAYTLIRFGDLSMSTGARSARRAMTIYRKARGILDDPTAGIGPRDRDALELRAELDKLEATMAWQAGDRARSIVLLRAHTDRAERLIEMDPGLPRRRRMLAKGTRTLALAQRDQGQLKAAVESFRASVEAWRLLREMEPDKVNWRREWGRTLRLLADALAHVGRWEESTELHDVSISLLEGMLTDGALPASSRLEVGAQILDAAQGQLAAGNLRRARELWERAETHLGHEAPSKRDTTSWFQNHSRASVIEAELLLAEGRWVAAEECALDFVAELQGRALRGKDAQLRSERARTLLVVSAVRAMDGDARVARDARQRALAIADELLAEKPNDLEAMALKTRALFVLGRDAAAAKMLDELDELGYRDVQLGAVRAAVSALRR